jgi:hypothetical protein
MSIRQTVQKIFAIMVLEYGDKFNTTPERMAMWVNMLDGMDGATALAAAMHLVSTGGPFPPTIGEVRRKIAELSRGELAAPSPYEAWSHVLEYVSECNKPSYMVEFGEDNEQASMPAITEHERIALKHIGGGSYLYNSTNKSIDRSNFIKAYSAIVDKAQNQELALPVVKKLVESNAPRLPARVEKPRLPAVETVPDVDLVEVNEMINRTIEMLGRSTIEDE